jgi:hypothetical protein
MLLPHVAWAENAAGAPDAQQRSYVGKRQQSQEGQKRYQHNPQKFHKEKREVGF